MDEFGSMSRDSRRKQDLFNGLVTHSLKNQELINDRFQKQLDRMREIENERYETLSQSCRRLNQTILILSIALFVIALVLLVSILLR